MFAQPGTLLAARYDSWKGKTTHRAYQSLSEPGSWIPASIEGKNIDLSPFLTWTARKPIGEGCTAAPDEVVAGWLMMNCIFS